MTFIFRTIMLTALLFVVSPAYADNSTLKENEAPLLTEKNFVEVIKMGNCIVMYYNPDEGSRSIYGMTPMQLGDHWMRTMMAFKERLGSSVKFYRVNWKGFSEESIGRIRSDLASSDKFPGSPNFAVYAKFNARPSRVSGPSRPDALPWFIHGIMDDFIPVVKKDKGEFLFTGWLITDTSAPYINVARQRVDSIEFNGRTETVQIIDYVSQPYDGFACEYQRIYSRDGKLLGSIETYGRYGKFGYFDYDRTGKFQYRVSYGPGDGKE